MLFAIYNLILYYIVVVCHLIAFISLVCPSCVTRMYSYAIRMSLVCTHMSPIWHSYVLVCQPYVTRMYSYVIRMSLVRGFTMNSQNGRAKSTFINTITVSLLLLQLSFICNIGKNLWRHIYHSPPNISVITENIVITTIRFACYHSLLASNSTFMTDSL